MNWKRGLPANCTASCEVSECAAKGEQLRPKLKEALCAAIVAWLSEVCQRSGFGIERRDSFDESRNSKRIAHAAGAAHKTQRSAFPSQLNGNANQGRDAGAINLRNTIEVNHNFSRTTLDDGLQSLMKLLARFPNRQAASHIENRDGPGFPHGDFHGRMLSHSTSLENLVPLLRHRPPGQSCRDGGFATEMHYTMAPPPRKNRLAKNCRAEL